MNSNKENKNERLSLFIHLLYYYSTQGFSGYVQVCCDRYGISEDKLKAVLELLKECKI